MALGKVADEVKGVVEDLMTTMTGGIMVIQIENIEVVEGAMMTSDVEDDRVDITIDMTMIGLIATTDITLAPQVTTWDCHLPKDDFQRE